MGEVYDDFMEPGELKEALSIYWNEAERCREAEALWALLHVTVCIPDICAALRDGPRKAGVVGSTYRKWCDDYLTDPGPSGALTSAARWEMRNKVLHEGTAQVEPKLGFNGFAFLPPLQPPHRNPHKQILDGTLLIDVVELAEETHAGVDTWISDVEAYLDGSEAQRVGSNLESLVRVRPRRVFSMTEQAGVSLIDVQTILRSR